MEGRFRRGIRLLELGVRSLRDGGGRGGKGEGGEGGEQEGFLGYASTVDVVF